MIGPQEFHSRDLLIALAIVLGGAAYCGNRDAKQDLDLYNTTKEKVKITISHKFSDAGRTKHYFIGAVHNDGTTETFENRNTAFIEKPDAAEFQDSLHVNSEYVCEAYGERRSDQEQHRNLLNCISPQ